MASEWDVVETSQAPANQSQDDWGVVSTTPARSNDVSSQPPEPVSNLSPRAREALEAAQTFTGGIKNLYERYRRSTEGAEAAAMRRPIEGAAMGFFAPETARIMGAGMRAIPYAPVRAAGELLYQAAPAIPRRSSTTLGATAGTAGTLAEREARDRGLSPEAASVIGTGAELATGLGIPAVASRLPRITTTTTRAEEAAKRAVTEAEARGGALERQVSGRLGETIEQTQARASASETRLGQIDQALQQIAERDAVAAARAENRALDPAAVAEIRRRVTRRLQDDVTNATKEAREAGLTVDAARAEALERVALAEQNKLDASVAVERLTAAVAARPQMDGAAFGERLRATVRQLADRFENARARASGFGNAVQSAGTDPIVQTGDIGAYIRRYSGPGDPALRQVLSVIERETKTAVEGGEPLNALSVEAADSLRKYINNALTSKRIRFEGGEMGVDAAAIHHLTQIRNMLEASATKAHAPYGRALETFRRMSEPAEFRQMQVGGALRRLFARDVRTQNELLAASDVVGEMMRKSRGGYPVFEGVIAANPELVDAARMYFNRELFFGGRTPTTEQLRGFLQQNERALRSLGLFDEFSTIREARGAAQRAMENADKRVREARAAVRGIEAAEMRAAPSRRLISTAKGRQAEAVSGLETIEDIAKASARRAREAETRLAGERTRIQPEVERSRALTRDLRTAQINIERAAPGETVAAIRPAIGRLRREGFLSDADYGRWVTEMQAVDDAFSASAKAAKDAEEARKASQAVMKRWRDRLVGAVGAGAGFATAGLFGFGPARYRRQFRE